MTCQRVDACRYRCKKAGLIVPVAAAVLFASALLTSWLPAARAARIDIIAALRSE